MHQFTGMWLNPNSRGSRLRIWQPWGCNSLHAHHLRRLASAGIADPGDLKSPSLPGALQFAIANHPVWGIQLARLRKSTPRSPTGVWLTGNSRPIRLKIEQPWECKSPHVDQFGMSTGLASRTCLLNSGLPERGVWCECTAFRHSCARSSKRAGGLIPRIALDQCRVPERYRTRVPFRTPEREVAQAAQRFQKVMRVSRWKRPARGSKTFNEFHK